MKKHRTEIILVTVLFILGASALVCQHWYEFFGPHHTTYLAKFYAGDTDDIPPLLLRVRECKTLLQTRSYWHEDYTPRITYYRPLDLTMFWLEYQAFGANDFRPWVIVSVLEHVLFCGIFGLFLTNLTQSKPAAIVTLIVFAGFRTFGPLNSILTTCDIYHETPALVAVQSWKDQPTLISDTLTILALIFVQYRKWGWSLFSALAGVLFKESANITYPMILLFTIYEGALPKVPKQYFVIGALFLAIPFAARYFSGMGAVVPHVGEPFSLMMTRFLPTTCGVYFEGFIHSRWAATLFGTAMYLLVRLKPKSPYVALTCVIISVIVGGTINSLSNGGTVIDGIAVLLDPSLQFNYSIVCFCCCVMVDSALQYQEFWRSILIVAAFSLLADIPDVVVRTPANEHRMHLVFAFQAGVSGILITAFLRQCRLRLLPKLRELFSRGSHDAFQKRNFKQCQAE